MTRDTMLRIVILGAVLTVTVLGVVSIALFVRAGIEYHP